MRESFQNLANQILDSKAERLKEQSAEQLNGLLDPFKVQLKEFREAFTLTHANEQRERGMLAYLLAQPLPFWGKRDLKRDIAAAEAEQAVLVGLGRAQRAVDQDAVVAHHLAVELVEHRIDGGSIRVANRETPWLLKTSRAVDFPEANPPVRPILMGRGCLSSRFSNSSNTLKS